GTAGADLAWDQHVLGAAAPDLHPRALHDRALQAIDRRRGPLHHSAASSSSGSSASGRTEMYKVFTRSEPSRMNAGSGRSPNLRPGSGRGIEAPRVSIQTLNSARLTLEM